MINITTELDSGLVISSIRVWGLDLIVAHTEEVVEVGSLCRLQVLREVALVKMGDSWAHAIEALNEHFIAAINEELAKPEET